MERGVKKLSVSFKVTNAYTKMTDEQKFDYVQNVLATQKEFKGKVFRRLTRSSLADEDSRAEIKALHKKRGLSEPMENLCVKEPECLEDALRYNVQMCVVDITSRTNCVC